MVKWLVTLFLALAILSVAMPVLRERLAIGRLPGDFRLALRGRVYYIPFMSSLVLSLLLWGIGRLF